MKHCQEWLLHIAWFRKLYRKLSFFNLGNYAPAKVIEILYPGTPNNNAGPDFLNAKIRINSVIWVGNVEIHRKASDWFLHKHEEDPAYDGTILHVVLEDDCLVYERKSKNPLFSCVMELDEDRLNRVEQLPSQSIPLLKCTSQIERFNLDKWASWKTLLFEERIRQKEDRIAEIYYSRGEDIAETLHVLLLRYWGNKVNNDAFQQLALNLPIRILRKHTDSLVLLEALYLGQAGLLQESLRDDYQAKLKEHYTFLQAKYGLEPLPEGAIRLLRLRPSAFPHRRLAQMASLRYHYPLLESEILSIQDTKSALELLRVSPSEYWDTHYVFGKEVGRKIGNISAVSVQSLLINVVLPYKLFLSTLGQIRFSIEEVQETLMGIKAEDNKTVRMFVEAGVEVKNAFESQALLQLWDEYCISKECFRCQLGRYFFSK